MPNEIKSDSFKEKMISMKIKELFGYEVIEFEVSELIDEDGIFQVYTAFLELTPEQRDYSILIEQEWEVSEALDLYNNKTILRFI